MPGAASRESAGRPAPPGRRPPERDSRPCISCAVTATAMAAGHLLLDSLNADRADDLPSSRSATPSAANPRRTLLPLSRNDQPEPREVIRSRASVTTHSPAH